MVLVPLMNGSTSWSENPANVQAPPLSPPTSLSASSESIRSPANDAIPSSDTDRLIPSDMGSSSCCRANHGYEKVPPLGYSQCVQSTTEDSLAVYVHVRTTPRTSPLYAPEKIEQRQKHAARDAQIRSSSTRRDIAANLPQHVRSRPHDDPLPHNNTGSSRKHIPHESCVQPPPNRSPFTLNTTFPTRLNSYSSGCSSGGSSSSSSSVSSNSSSGSSSSSRSLPSIRNSSYPSAPTVTRFPGYSGKKAI